MGRFKNRYTVCLNYKNSDPGGRFRGEKIWWKIFHFLSSFLQMKNNPVQDKSPIHGDDFVILPEPRTAINICSKDTMNITVSQCSLNVLHNLAKVQQITTSSTDFIRKWKCEFLCSKNYHCQLNRKLNPFHDLLFNSSTDWMAEKKHAINITFSLFWSGILWRHSLHLWLFSEGEGPLHHQKHSRDSSHRAAQCQPEASGSSSTRKTTRAVCGSEHGPGTLHVQTVVTRKTVGASTSRELPVQPHHRSERCTVTIVSSCYM